MAVYIGAMSGTSLDGVDAAAFEITSKSGAPKLNHIESAHTPYSKNLQSRILDLIEGRGGAREASLLDTDIGHIYTKTIKKLLHKARVTDASIRAVGIHGQTVWHEPLRGATLQLGDAALISHGLSLDVWSDFRSADLAAGGQGAPLAPIAHHALFASRSTNVVVINIGGISNLTHIPQGAKHLNELVAYDIGPGVMLLDMAARAMGLGACDNDGAEAAKHVPDEELLAQMMDHPYFKKRPPKSTGREEFGAAFLKWSCISNIKLAKGVTLATFTKLTAMTIAKEIIRLHKRGKITDRLILCGGGANNRQLIKLIKNACPTLEVFKSNEVGMDEGNVETALIAILAWYAVKGVPFDLSTITGSKTKVSLGKLSSPVNV